MLVFTNSRCDGSDSAHSVVLVVVEGVRCGREKQTHREWHRACAEKQREKEIACEKEQKRK